MRLVCADPTTSQTHIKKDAFAQVLFDSLAVSSVMLYSIGLTTGQGTHTANLEPVDIRSTLY